jgi:hypothetical protein
MQTYLIFGLVHTNTGLADCSLNAFSPVNNHLVMLISLLQELRSNEEKLVHKLELDREKNSVAHLTQAKADCEGIDSPHLYLFPLVISASEAQERIIASLGSLG